MTNAEFTAAYLEAMHWDGSVVLDENLSMHYPVCVYSFSGRRVIALAQELEEAMEDVPRDASLQQALDALFELEDVRVTKETVIGYYAGLPQFGRVLPAIADEAALMEMLDAMQREDRLRGEVTLQDDFTCCIMQDGRMAAAAGAVIVGKMADISVAVHPDFRAQGLGGRVTASLIRKIQDAGYTALYRVEKNNLPSVRLAQRLGLQRGFIMEGALLEFPEA